MQGTRTRAWTHTTPPSQRRSHVAPVGCPRMPAASLSPAVPFRRARHNFCAEGRRSQIRLVEAATL